MTPEEKLQLIAIVIILLISIFGAYLISISNLPEWFKFWILK